MNFIESTSSLKGIKLQSYIATYSLLEAKVRECKLKKNGIHQYSDVKMHTFFAIEFIDDVIEYDKAFETYDIKQLKNYSSDFNINSKEIKKAIKNFMSIYIKDYQRESTYFSFLSTSKIINEIGSKLLSVEDVEALNDIGMPFLQILKAKKHRDNKVLICKIITSILNENENVFDSELINNEELILDFLDHIDWYFEIDNLDLIQKKSLQLIPQIDDYYNNDMIGKEDVFFFYLVQQFESNAIVEIPNVRFMLGKADLELAFIKFRRNDYKANEIPADILNEQSIVSYLNMKEKIQKAYPSAAKSFTDMYDIAVTKGKVNLNAIATDEKNSYQEAIYVLANKFIKEYFVSNLSIPNNEKKIVDFLSKTTDFVQAGMIDNSKDFNYRFSSKSMIEKTIYVLFEDCFLDFN